MHLPWLADKPPRSERLHLVRYTTEDGQRLRPTERFVDSAAGRMGRHGHAAVDPYRPDHATELVAASTLEEPRRLAAGACGSCRLADAPGETIGPAEAGGAASPAFARGGRPAFHTPEGARTAGPSPRGSPAAAVADGRASLTGHLAVFAENNLRDGVVSG